MMLWVKQKENDEYQVIHKLHGVVKTTSCYRSACIFIDKWPNVIFEDIESSFYAAIDIILLTDEI